jgi:putative hemolysin
MVGRSRVAVCLLGVLSALAACGGGPRNKPTTTIATTTTTSAAVANPASIYCESRGGRVELVTNANGQQGICELPDGTRVDEWDLYRANHPTASTMAAPASSTTTTSAVGARCSAGRLDPKVADEPGLSSAAAAMRADLARAAATCDYTALAALADRGGPAVRFSFGPETDPIAFWKEAEAGGHGVPPMLALRTLLGLPYATTTVPSGAVQYVWPAAFAAEHPTTAQLDEIANTGLYSMATLQDWVRGGNNYLGYRIIITAEGDWTAFVEGD